MARRRAAAPWLRCSEGCLPALRQPAVYARLTNEAPKVNNNQLDDKEQNLLHSFERGEWQSVPNLEEEIGAARPAARNTFNKTKRVNLRVTERDFDLAHARAREERIPYQTLLSSVIHKYLSGRLTEKR